MNSVVIYASRTGNTKRIAEAIAAGLRPRGPVQLVSADEAPTTFPGVDLVVVGGPTEAHGMTAGIIQYLDRIDSLALEGKATAAYDTRLRWPRWLSGSAAAGIAERLRGLGARVIVSEESFIVTRKPRLEPGEMERASAWAASLAGMVQAGMPAVAGGG
jgi:flavodoxin